jgi:hypothetical protein
MNSNSTSTWDWNSFVIPTDSDSDSELSEKFVMLTPKRSQKKNVYKKRFTREVVNLKSLLMNSNSFPTGPKSVCSESSESSDSSRTLRTLRTNTFRERNTHMKTVSPPFEVYKPVVKKDFSKTRMCSSVAKKFRCPHGDTCGYAHSTEELRVQECGFDFLLSRCNKKPNCSFKHSDETKEDYIKRITRVTPVRKMKMSKFVEKKPKITSGFFLAGQTKVFKKPVVKEEEVIVKVTKDLAINTVKMLITGGERKFRIIIV